MEATIVDTLSTHAPDVVAAWLFGSRARGTARPNSDVDVAILLARDPPDTLDGLHLDLQEALSERLHLPVQLVVMNRAPVELVRTVMVEGRLLMDRDVNARAAFEVNARNAWWDLEPYLVEYRRGARGA